MILTNKDMKEVMGGSSPAAPSTSSESEVNQELQKLSQELQQINQIISAFLKAYDQSATKDVAGIK